MLIFLMVIAFIIYILVLGYRCEPNVRKRELKRSMAAQEERRQHALYKYLKSPELNECVEEIYKYYMHKLDTDAADSKYQKREHIIEYLHVQQNGIYTCQMDTEELSTLWINDKMVYDFNAKDFSVEFPLIFGNALCTQLSNKFKMNKINGEAKVYNEYQSVMSIKAKNPGWIPPKTYRTL